MKKSFKIVKCGTIDCHTDVETKIEMYVPGINSGVHDKALRIHMKGVKELKGLLWKRKRNVHLNITLPRHIVEQLRDECNKMLELK